MYSALRHVVLLLAFSVLLGCGEPPPKKQVKGDEESGPKYTVLDTRTDNFDTSLAKSQGEDAIAKYPDLGCMVGLFAYNPPALLEALKGADKVGEIRLVGFDEQDETLQAIKDGHCHGTVVQNPYKYGYESVTILAGLARGDERVLPPEGFLNIPARKITKDNVDEFWADLRKLTAEDPAAEAGQFEDEPTIGFVTNGIASFWLIAEKGARDAGRKLRVNVEVRMPPSGVADQQRMIEELLTLEVDGIAVSPIDGENQTDFLNKVAEKTKLITHDSDAPNAKRICYVGMDNYLAGKMCGELVREAIPNGGSVMLFVGRLEQDNAKARNQGTIDGILGKERDEDATPTAKTDDESQGASAPPEPEPPVELAFVTNNASDFWKIAEAGVRKAEKEFNARCEMHLPPAGTAEDQQRIIESLIAKDISGMAISPNDAENQVSIINQAAEHMAVICHDSDAPKSNRLAYVGTNNYQAGREAGKLLKDVLPKGGQIMLFVGRLDAQNAIERKQGIEDELQGSQIEILDTRTDLTDRSRAKQNAEDAMTRHPGISCLVGLWSYNGPAILEAVKDAGQQGKIPIVCFDEEEGTLQGVLDGHIHATVVQQPYEFGYQSVRVLAALARNEDAGIPEDKVVEIPVKVIRRESVQEFWDNLKRIKTGA
jgi:ribose transport system substrate-binding protein